MRKLCIFSALLCAQKTFINTTKVTPTELGVMHACIHVLCVCVCVFENLNIVQSFKLQNNIALTPGGGRSSYGPDEVGERLRPLWEAGGGV